MSRKTTRKTSNRKIRTKARKASQIAKPEPPRITLTPPEGGR